MKNKWNVLVLKSNENSFERFYTNKFRELCDADWIYRSDNILRRAWIKYNLPFEAIWYGKWKKKLKSYDLIILFDYIRSANIIRFLQQNASCRIVFWHWNPVSEFDRIIIEETRGLCENWTFNPVDAKKYKMKINSQFYFNVELEKNNLEGEGIFFIGLDKGRYNLLHQIAEMANEIGVKLDLNLVVDDKNGYLDDRIKYHDSFMNYEDIIHRIIFSKCILELVQDSQDGLTARALEAIFYGRKLITNNCRIKEYDFYNSNNIYIIGHENRSLGEFYWLPYIDVEKSILEKYSACEWINRFFADYSSITHEKNHEV